MLKHRLCLADFLYIIAPEKTLNEITKIFLENKDVLKYLAIMIYNNEIAIKEYEKLKNHDYSILENFGLNIEKVELMKKTYKAVSNANKDTVKVQYEWSNKPINYRTRTIINEIETISGYLSGHPFEEIINIASGKDVVYQKY